DEAVAAAIEQRIERGSGASASDGPAVLAPEILCSPAFRAELREFWRVLDDFDLDPAHLLEQLAALRGRAASEAMTDAPDDARIERWSEALRVIVEVEARLRDERPGELSSSALLRSAARELRSG